MAAIFEHIRAKVETDVAHPAVVAITSATNEDGRELAARALAASLAAAGYSTLLIDAHSETNGSLSPVEGISLDEIARREIATDSSKLAVFSIAESVQRKSNHRHTKAAFDILRERFDYIIISANLRGSLHPFAANVVSLANAVLVSVKLGRRRTRDDSRLAANLNRLGPKFRGIFSMTQSTMDIAAETHPSNPAGKTEPWRAPMPTIEKTIGRREATEWPT
jgi:Mrp family chromosome partitioning ATPase